MIQETNKREIKFRGMDFHKSIWRYGTYYVGVMYPNSFTGHYMDDWQVDPETVGQFTGLKDKNGKDRYEGDIIKRSTGYTFEEKIRSYQMGDKNCAICVGYDYHPKDEIIGNVFEDTHLLLSGIS